MKKIRCPMCNRYMLTDSFDSNIYFCDTRVDWDQRNVYHYKQQIPSSTYTYGHHEPIRHVMIVPPYRIVSYNDHSVIQKLKKNSVFSLTFDFTIDTRDLNLDPILPMPEKDLLSRINTILVFS